MKKTNASRILDRLEIPYEILVGVLKKKNHLIF